MTQCALSQATVTGGKERRITPLQLENRSTYNYVVYNYVHVVYHMRQLPSVTAKHPHTMLTVIDG